MKVVVVTFMLVCGTVLQAVIPTSAVPGDVRVPILQGIVLYYALTRSQKTAIKVAILAGILQDSLSIIPLGYSCFCYGLIVWVVSTIKAEIYVWSWITHCLLGATANALVTAVLYVLLLQSGTLAMSPGTMFMKLFGAVLMGAVVAPLVFRVAESLDQKLGVLEGREAL